MNANYGEEFNAKLGQRIVETILHRVFIARITGQLVLPGVGSWKSRYAFCNASCGRVYACEPRASRIIIIASIFSAN